MCRCRQGNRRTERGLARWNDFNFLQTQLPPSGSSGGDVAGVGRIKRTTENAKRGGHQVIAGADPLSGNLKQA